MKGVRKKYKEIERRHGKKHKRKNTMKRNIKERKEWWGIQKITRKGRETNALGTIIYLCFFCFRGFKFNREWRKQRKGSTGKSGKKKSLNLSFTFAPADSKYQIGIEDRKQWRERKDHYFTCIPADCKISARSKKRKYRKTWRNPEIHIICTVCTRNLAVNCFLNLFSLHSLLFYYIVKGLILSLFLRKHLIWELISNVLKIFHWSI